MGAHAVHHVAEFMEKCNDVSVRKQRWPLRCWLVEVAKHSGSSWNHLTVNSCSLQKGEHRSVTELVVSWMQVEIEMTESFLSLRILNQIHSGIFVPQLHVRNLSEFEA